jgi:hypothetical protein
MQEVETMPEVETIQEVSASVVAYGGVIGARNEADLRLYRLACEREARLDAGLSKAIPIEDVMREFGMADELE